LTALEGLAVHEEKGESGLLEFIDEVRADMRAIVVEAG
jgi:hypothetical protein